MSTSRLGDSLVHPLSSIAVVTKPDEHLIHLGSFEKNPDSWVLAPENIPVRWNLETKIFFKNVLIY